MQCYLSFLSSFAYLQLFSIIIPGESRRWCSQSTCDTRNWWNIWKLVRDVNPCLCPIIFTATFHMWSIVEKSCWKGINYYCFFPVTYRDVQSVEITFIIIFSTPAPEGSSWIGHPKNMNQIFLWCCQSQTPVREQLKSQHLDFSTFTQSMYFQFTEPSLATSLVIPKYFRWENLKFKLCPNYFPGLDVT